MINFIRIYWYCWLILSFIYAGLSLMFASFIFNIVLERFEELWIVFSKTSVIFSCISFGLFLFSLILNLLTILKLI